MGQAPHRAGERERIPLPEFYGGFLLTCVCGKSYWPNQAWLHKGCAINAAPVAINKRGVAINAGKSANRRDRAVYNGYMRDYMKRYRALKKSAPIES